MISRIHSIYIYIYIYIYGVDVDQSLLS
jgi:hypothetical protein